jgi:phosphoadenosine phosphosulfate reductase
VLRWVAEHFPRERRIVVSALQAEGTAIADMALSADPEFRIVTIDTGRLPEETLAYATALRSHWGREIEVTVPEPADLEPFLSQHGPNSFYTSAELRLRCCELRKVRPLARILAGVDCWVSGLRRSQSADRAEAPLLGADDRHGGILKVNPLAAWSAHDVRDYLAERGVPAHPLYAMGYASIGCAPCTRAVHAGEDERAGRWWWEQGIAKECGMHTLPVLPAEAQ